MGKYTRRQFITSAGVGMAAVAGLGLAGCAPQTPADKAMANTGNGGTTFADTIAWDGEYDVVVIGFGGAGAVSACYAADAGAKVLLIDKAPQGMEGGNTRFCGQIILNSDDKEAMLAYNKAMAGDFAVDDELMDAYAEGLTQTKTMLRDFFGVPEENFLDWKEDSSAQPMIAMFVPEYPELEGGDALHVLTVSDNVCNSALWKTYRNKVMSMSDNIDVWYMSPATKLFQDPVSRAVIGVEIDKAGETVNIRAKNGVVMTMGGFENNKQMVEDFLGLTKSTPAGTLFNTGDGSGIKQALWVGAAMQANGDHPPMMFWGATNCIKNVMVNSSGKRFIDENSGQSNLAAAQFHQTGGTMVALWNEAYAEQLPAISYRSDDPSWAAKPEELRAKWEGLVEAGVFMKADTLDEIAEAYGLPADALSATVEEYNGYCAAGVDEAFHKDPATLHELTGPYYATKYDVPASLASMGGLHVNAQCEVLTADDQPIEGLYAIGLAAGDFYANQYSTRYAGNSLGRCMTFGYLIGRELAGLE